MNKRQMTSKYRHWSKNITQKNNSEHYERQLVSFGGKKVRLQQIFGIFQNPHLIHTTHEVLLRLYSESNVGLSY
jgi:hypothetical protein